LASASTCSSWNFDEKHPHRFVTNLPWTGNAGIAHPSLAKCTLQPLNSIGRCCARRDRRLAPADVLVHHARMNCIPLGDRFEC
jgi:hypothetical protein